MLTDMNPPGSCCYNPVMDPKSLITIFLGFANQLKFRNLFLLILGLFIIDLLIPDFIPLIDEIILGLLAIILANWKKEKSGEKQGELIEGETIENGDDNQGPSPDI